LLVFLPQLFFLRMQDSISSRAEGRWDIFVVGTQVVRHYGILGAGLESFRAAYTEFAGFAPVFRGLGRDPHDIYLQVWAELGVVGLGLFFAAIWSQLKDLYIGNRGRRASPNYTLLAMEAACWALLVHGFSGNLLWRKEFWMTWMLAALAFQLFHAADADKSERAARIVTSATPGPGLGQYRRSRGHRRVNAGGTASGTDRAYRPEHGLLQGNREPDVARGRSDDSQRNLEAYGRFSDCDFPCSRKLSNISRRLRFCV